MFRAPHCPQAPRAILLSMSLAVLAATPAQAVSGGSSDLTGTLVTVVDGPAPDSRVQVADGSFVPVPAEKVRNVAPGSTVRVTVDRRGIARADAAAERGFTPGGSTTTGTSGVASATTVVAPPQVSGVVSASTHGVTVALVVPSGVTGTAATEAQARAQVDAADKYWSEQSGGTVRFTTASVSAPMNLAAGCSDYWGMWQEAARRTNFRTGTDQHLVMILPRAATSSGCSYGLGSIGASPNSGGYVYVSDTNWPVLAHELGHNLGLAHAERLLCSTVGDASLGALGAAGCQVKDYGDPWDVMAASAPNNAGSLSTPQGYRTGLLPSAAVTQVTSGTATVTLNAVSQVKGTRAVRVIDPNTGIAYFVEYRARSGRDYLLYAPMIGGVRILREDTNASGAAKPSLALDASPTGSATDYTWGLGVGGSFTSYGGGVTVRVTAQNDTTATVGVTAGKPVANPTTNTSAPTPTSTTTTRPPTTTPPTTTSPTTVDISGATGQLSRTGPYGWYDVKATGYLFGTALVTYTSGASWTTTVQGGRTMEILGTAFPGGAPGRIYLDGKPAGDFTSNRAGWTNNYGQVLARLVVPAGSHKVAIVALPNPALGQSTLALDAYRLR